MNVMKCSVKFVLFQGMSSQSVYHYLSNNLFSLSCHSVFILGEVLIVPDVEFQRQVLDAVNCVLYEQLKYKGNEMDYYNSLNSYIHQASMYLLNQPRKPLLVQV